MATSTKPRPKANDSPAGQNEPMENQQPAAAVDREASPERLRERLSLIATVLRKTSEKSHGILCLRDSIIAYGTVGYACSKPEKITVDAFRQWAAAFGMEFRGFGTDTAAEENGRAWVMAFAPPAYMPEADDWAEKFVEHLERTLDSARVWANYQFAGGSQPPIVRE